MFRGIFINKIMLVLILNKKENSRRGEVVGLLPEWDSDRRSYLNWFFLIRLRQHMRLSELLNLRMNVAEIYNPFNYDALL